MGLFRKNDNESRPRPTPKGAVICLAVLLCIGVVARCIGGAKTREEKDAELEAYRLYYAWDEAYILDDVADANLINTREIDDAGRYCGADEKYGRKKDMYGRIDRFILESNDSLRKAWKGYIADYIKALDEDRLPVDSLTAAILREEASWTERLDGADSAYMRTLYERKRGEVMDEYEKAIRMDGKLYTFEVRFLRSKSKMRLTFVQPEGADSLILVDGDRIY